MYDFLRRIVPGVSWKNPVIATGLRLIDPLDWVVRRTKGLHAFPRLSLRVRSNGLRGQFGGENFDRLGRLFSRELQRLADVRRDSRVLEVGCGVGRNAFGLSSTLDKGNYTGVDIDLPSILAAQRNRFLKEHGCVFQFIDLRNDEYNPTGKFKASEFEFPFDDGRFDIIFMVSVVTHILPPDFEPIVEEISRMIRPGGRFVFTTFLMDEGAEFDGRRFEFGTDQWRSTHKDLPEISVGYYLSYLDEVLDRNGFERDGEAAMSEKRGNSTAAASTQFGQDIVVAVRR